MYSRFRSFSSFLLETTKQQRTIHELIFSFLEFPGGFLSKLLWLLPSKIFHFGECPKFRLFQKEHGTETHYENATSNGISGIIQLDSLISHVRVMCW